MALLLKIANVLTRAAARLALLLLSLFVIHLAIHFAFPYLRESLNILENRPILNARVESLRAQLKIEDAEGMSLKNQLDRLADEQRMRFLSHLEHLRQEVKRVENEKFGLEARLLNLQREQAEYCKSYNPLKRWTCYELKTRNANLQNELEEGLSSLRRKEQALLRATHNTQEELTRLQERLEGNAEHLLLELSDARETDARLKESRRASTALQTDLAKAEAKKAQADAFATSPWGRLLTEWRRVSPSLLLIVALMVTAPYLQRAVAYFVLMPLVARASPLLLAETPGGTQQRARPHEAVRTLQLSLPPGSDLYLRASHARALAKTPDCRVSSQLLYRWSAPFISYAAGLSMLTRIQIPETAPKDQQVSVSAPSSPDSYLRRVDLNGHPGLVVHPRHLVGLLGDIELVTRWRVFHLHAWSRGQLRYILLRGTGSVLLEGWGDIVVEDLKGSLARIEQAHLMGFDGRLATSTRRTETFLPYLFGQTPLVDAQFEGQGIYFWQKSVCNSTRPAIERVLDAFFGSVGKLLGF